MLGAILVVIDQVRLVADLTLHHRLLRGELPADADAHGRKIPRVQADRSVLRKPASGICAVVDVAQRVGCRLERERDIRAVQRELVREILDGEITRFCCRGLLIGIVALQPDRVAVVHRKIRAVVVVSAADQVGNTVILDAVHCLEY